MGRSSVKGFKLHGTRNTDVMLSQIWKNIVTKKQLPEPSDRSEEYSFDLMYDEQIFEKVNINCTSFPIHQSNKTDETESEYAKGNVDGLFIFSDANSIILNKHDSKRSPLTEFLQSIPIKEETNKLYTAIVITNCNDIKKEQLKNLNEIKELVSKSIVDLLGGRETIFDVFFVSSIGQRPIDIPATLSYKSPSSLSMCFNLDATNVTNPILFFLEWFINKNIQMSESRLSNQVDELTKLINSYSMKEELLNLIFNRPKINDQIIKKIGQLNELQNSLNFQKMMSIVIQQENK